MAYIKNLNLKKLLVGSVFRSSDRILVMVNHQHNCIAFESKDKSFFLIK